MTTPVVRVEASGLAQLALDEEPPPPVGSIVVAIGNPLASSAP